MELFYMLEQTGLWQHRRSFLEKHNSSSNKSAGRKDIEKYRAQLNREQIDFLNNMYAPDLEMFGYDPI